MPVLLDDDLRFEDARGRRATTVVNDWLRELPINKVPAWRSWWAYARAVVPWLEFLRRYGVDALGAQEELRAALSAFAEFRLAGPLAERWETESGPALFRRSVQPPARCLPLVSYRGEPAVTRASSTSQGTAKCSWSSRCGKENPLPTRRRRMRCSASRRKRR